MARRRLPIFTERTLAETKADQVSDQHRLRDPLGKVSCRVGCSNCCSHAVYATLLEGMLTYQSLARRGRWTPSLRKRLEEHARTTWDLSPVVWHLMNLVCPLLEQNQCSAYQARPFSCRATFSAGDPADCHPHRVNQAPLVIPKRDALETFYAKQHRLLRRHGLDLFLFPLSKAILLGEQVSTGAVDIEQYLQLLTEKKPL